MRITGPTSYESLYEIYVTFIRKAFCMRRGIPWASYGIDWTIIMHSILFGLKLTDDSKQPVDE